MARIDFNVGDCRIRFEEDSTLLAKPSLYRSNRNEMNGQWKNRYYDLAGEVATWSKDPSKKVGAIIVGNHGQVLSQGYNGFPRGMDDDPKY